MCLRDGCNNLLHFTDLTKAKILEKRMKRTFCILIPIMVGVLIIDLIVYCAVYISLVLTSASVRPGDTVILECGFTLKLSQSVDVLWEKEGDVGIVYRYEKGKISLIDQNPNFRNRTSLFLDWLPTGNASLKITNVQAKDAGIYRCTVTNSVRKIEGKLSLHVGVPPNVTVADASGMPGESVVLPCSINGTFPQNIDVLWKKMGYYGDVYRYVNGRTWLSNQIPEFRGRTSLFFDRLAVGNASLILNHIRVEDAGNYTCSIASSEGTGQNMLDLRVRVIGPVITSDAAAVVGNDVTLRCTFTPAVTQSSNVLWEKVGDGIVYRYENGNVSLTDQSDNFRGRTSLYTDRLSVGDASLRISNVRMEDTGVYRCTISNSNGRGGNTLNLDVQAFGPVITYNAAAVMGNNVTLRCTFTPVVTQSSNVLWEKVGDDRIVYRYENGNVSLTDQSDNFRGRTSLYTDRLSVGDASLTITNVRVEDTGVYRCTISNSIGRGSDMLNLNIQAFGPVITYNAAAVVGNDVTLRCTFTPVVTQSSNVLWEKVGDGIVYRYENGNVSLTDQSDNFRGRTSLYTDRLSVGDASLAITNVRVEDTGVYRCTISNSNGRGGNTLNLDVQVPDFPEYRAVRIVKTSGTSLRCLSSGWNPRPVVTWLENTRDLTLLSSTSYLFSDSGFKVISDFKWVKAKRSYTCIMKNRYYVETAKYSG